MRGGILRGCFPGGESDDEALHGWVVRGEVRLLGPWVPEVCMPFGRQLMCTPIGYELVESVGMGGGGMEVQEVLVASGLVLDKRTSLRRRGVRFRQLASAFEGRDRLKVEMMVPVFPFIEAALEFRSDEGIDVAVTKPLSDVSAVGWLAQGGDMSFGCGVVPRLWVSSEVFNGLSGLFPGWFRLMDSVC